MRKLHLILLILLLFVSDAISENSTCLRLIQTIPMPSVVGRIDHMAIDLEGQRLFVAPLGNNSLEVLDSHSFKHIRRIGGLNEPQGVLYIPEFGKIFVTNGGDGSCKVFDSKSFQLANFLKFSSDADNVRYDPRTKYTYVGYGNGALGTFYSASVAILGGVLVSCQEI